jgi:signal transduction histidine kinase
MLSAYLATAGSDGAPWWPVYLWVVLGYGFRYNEKYLYIASAFAFTCFGTILLTNDYWSSNPAVGFGLLISLIAIPAYVSKLLHKLNETMQHLSAAQKAAEEANRAKSDFLARMSHEIRTPLNGIIGSSELLQSCELGREQKEYADTIYASGHTMLHLIEDILDIVTSSGKKIENQDMLNQITLSVLLTKQFTYFLGRATNSYAALSRFEFLVEEILKLPERKKWITVFLIPTPFNLLQNSLV